jgi:hypothetical protein
MNYKFRVPPELSKPSTSRWFALFRINSKTEIWFIDMRNNLPNYFFPVVCDLQDKKPIPRYSISVEIEDFKKDHRLIEGWGDRFFWSEANKTFVIQISKTFEPSSRPEESFQIFLSGNDLLSIKKLEKMLLFPNEDYLEIYPEMHPDRNN